MQERTPALYEMTVSQARTADLASQRRLAAPPEPVAHIGERTIPGPGGDLTIRLYYPGGPGPLPTLLYFFGGGWTLGSVDTADAICRRLTNAAGCLTICVGYRLAPEHKFPAAVEDCHAAAGWVARHFADIDADPTRLVVGGDSAGGNLAAAVSLRARDAGGPSLIGQLLVYPNTDFGADTPSMRENTDPYFFNQTSVRWYWQHYLRRPEDGADPLASPLRAADHRALPPALVLTAEHDPIRDEGEQYARVLSQAGVRVESTRYQGMVHGFFAMSGAVDAARDAQEQAAAWLRARWSESEVLGRVGHR